MPRHAASDHISSVSRFTTFTEGPGKPGGYQVCLGRHDYAKRGRFETCPYHLYPHTWERLLAVESFNCEALQGIRIKVDPKSRPIGDIKIAFSDFQRLINELVIVAKVVA